MPKLKRYTFDCPEVRIKQVRKILENKEEFTGERIKLSPLVNRLLANFVNENKKFI